MTNNYEFHDTHFRFHPFVAQRSRDVSIYLRTGNIESPIDKPNINLNDGSWTNEKTLNAYGSVGIFHLSQSQQARYIAVGRNGMINLKEVQVYQEPSKFTFYHIYC